LGIEGIPEIDGILEFWELREFGNEGILGIPGIVEIWELWELMEFGNYGN